MTVEQAIEVLKKLPPDAILVHADYIEVDIAGRQQSHLEGGILVSCHKNDFSERLRLPGNEVVIVD